MDNHLFRHYLAALSYRTATAIKDAPPGYGNFEPGNGVRKPVDILHHMSMLLAYVTRCYTGHDAGITEVGSWQSEVERFYDLLEKLDGVLADGSSPLDRTVEQLLQGPLADAMTHVGQLSMLRRLADSPVPYENYMKADIRSGQVRPR